VCCTVLPSLRFAAKAVSNWTSQNYWVKKKWNETLHEIRVAHTAQTSAIWYIIYQIVYVFIICHKLNKYKCWLQHSIIIADLGVLLIYKLKIKCLQFSSSRLRINNKIESSRFLSPEQFLGFKVVQRFQSHLYHPVIFPGRSYYPLIFPILLPKLWKTRKLTLPIFSEDLHVSIHCIPQPNQLSSHSNLEWIIWLFLV